MKLRQLFRQLAHFFVIQQISFGAGAKYEVNIAVRQVVVIDVMQHAAEWRNAGSCAYKIQILFTHDIVNQLAKLNIRLEDVNYLNSPAGFCST